ncbi:LacI family DNA-binding transcriptional regulator [Streptomyces sp. NPDC088923]|uniref:LacI family DNA-binding transcriptional regulator n=1 Tax=Streptomyces sp. NPDC088923 TaxID=3365913 RepID=UPI00381DA1F6
MGYGEKRGDVRSVYYRGRYKVAPGRYATVKDSTGAVIKYSRRRDAKQAADRAEAALAESRKPYVDRRTQPTLAEYVQTWFAEQDLAASTLDNYRDHIESHILPAVGDVVLTDITAEAVRAWMQAERAAGYAASSVETYRAVLHLILEDAIAAGVPLTSNPAAKPSARRGRRSGREGRTDNRGPEKPTTSPLGVLLIAERSAILARRDDEFVQVLDLVYMMKRWGESIGMTTTHVHARGPRQRIEWQLYQRRDGTWDWAAPKDDSRRWVDTPPFMQALVLEQMRRRPPAPCECHQQATLFVDRRPLPGPTRDEVARAAGVSRAVVSRVHTAPHLVSARRRDLVLAAEEELGVGGPPKYGPHSARSDWRHAISTPAATGWFPSRGEHDPAYPVPVDVDSEFPGVVLRGRYSGERASGCWAPILRGWTPHLGRHIGKSWMDWLGTPKVLKDERMGHVDRSVPGIYSHVLPEMRADLMRGLTMLWEQSLTERLRLSPRSAAPTLDRLLLAHAEKITQNSPSGIMRRVIQRTNSLPDLAVWK